MNSTRTANKPGFSSANEIKIVFAGNVGSGKTAAIHTISEIPIAGTEAKATEKDALHRKKSTTVAMEYGQVNLLDTKIHLYGSPGQRRFDFMAPLLLQGASGIMVLIDNGCDDPLDELDYFLNFHKDFLTNNPALICVTHYDDNRTNTGLLDFHQYIIEHGFDIPVMRIDARKKYLVQLALEKLMREILTRKKQALQF